MKTKKLRKIISLVGPKHSGKTSVGKELALLLDADFIDLDFCIENRTEKSPRILYKEGAEVFRKAEFESLQSVLKDSETHTSDLVLATGGGIIDNTEAVNLLKEKTLMINLEVSSLVAWNRIVETSRISGELPPFLQSDNPEKTHRELHERRSRAYKNLTAFTVNVDNAAPKTIADHIKQFLSIKF
jgi:shikimate kinase